MNSLCIFMILIFFDKMSLTVVSVLIEYVIRGDILGQKRFDAANKISLCFLYF